MKIKLKNKEKPISLNSGWCFMNTGFEDLKKSKWYMDYLIKFEEEMGEGDIVKN